MTKKTLLKVNYPFNGRQQLNMVKFDKSQVIRVSSFTKLALRSNKKSVRRLVLPLEFRMDILYLGLSPPMNMSKKLFTPWTHQTN